MELTVRYCLVRYLDPTAIKSDKLSWTYYQKYPELIYSFILRIPDREK